MSTFSIGVQARVQLKWIPDLYQMVNRTNLFCSIRDSKNKGWEHWSWLSGSGRPALHWWSHWQAEHWNRSRQWEVCIIIVWVTGQDSCKHKHHLITICDNRTQNVNITSASWSHHVYIKIRFITVHTWMKCLRSEILIYHLQTLD
jgi:hypothetical protein